MTLAIVPARAGSKGIPDKNMAICAGKPLLEWTANAIRNSELVTDFMLSTDSKVMANWWSGSVHIARDISDTAQIEDRLDEVIRNSNCTTIVLLQPTSPIRTGKQIDEAIEQLQREKADSLVSVVPDHSLVWTDMAGKPLPSYDVANRPRRQDMNPPHYRETGNIYVFTRKHWERTRCRLGGKISLFVMPEESGYQVDTPFDLWLCGAILEKQKTLIEGNVW